MCVWDENNGKITLSDSVSLRANMPRKRVQESLEEFTGVSCTMDDPQHASLLSVRAFPFQGTKASCICSLHQGRLRSVALYPAEGTAARQREILFQFIGRQDPCPEAPQNVRIRYPFAMVWITTDSRSGDASLRITYAGKE